MEQKPSHTICAGSQLQRSNEHVPDCPIKILAKLGQLEQRSAECFSAHLSEVFKSKFKF